MKTEAVGTHAERAAIITHLCGAEKNRILDLGAGPGRTAAYLADLGHDVVAVEQIERCHYDPVHSRWIDEWQPAEKPENTLAQTIRYYTLADLLLYL